MPSYMTVVVLALAASNASVALAAPIHISREIQEQSLSRRDDGLPAGGPATGPLAESSVPPTGHPPQGYSPPDHPPLDHPPPGYRPVGPITHNIKVTIKPQSTATKGIRPYALRFLVGTAAAMAGISILNAITGGPSHKSSQPPPSTASSSPIISPSVNNLYPSANIMGNQHQQRAVDHDESVDFLDSKSVSDNNRRATSQLELLSRADLEDALKLFSRVLDSQSDELD